MAADAKWEVKYPAELMDSSFIIEDAMSLGSIMYAGTVKDSVNGKSISVEAGGMARNPTGYEKVLRALVGSDQGRPVMQGQTGVPKLIEVHICQAVTLIPVNIGM